MQQERVAIADLPALLARECSLNNVLRKLM